VPVTCPTCGTESRPDARFCSECATPLAAGCPACGTQNAPGAKFCSECATPLAPVPRPSTEGARPDATRSIAVGDAGAERRLVSVLFADLVGFTPFAEGRDAEDVRETLSRYFDLATDVVGRYGGVVEKFIGDAVMAVWGAPVAREDDAERAVRAGLELVDAVGSLGEGIRLRAGVVTGEAAVTIGATNQGMVAGDIVNTASRLQSEANPGTVLVGEATQRSASRAIAFEDTGEHVLKGKDAPVRAWRAVRVVARRGGRSRSDSLEAPFVGRDDELRLLKDLYQATCRERRPRLVSVIGPGGIGKSRLAAEFGNYLDGLVDNVWWHAGRSPAYGEGITFWALGEMIRSRAGLLESDDEPTTRTRIAAAVQGHVQDPAEAAWIEPALLALLGIDVQVDPQQLFAAWRTFFERLAATSPVVMVFEDLHHADQGLLDFIDHMMEWSRGVPILLMTLARPELLDRRSGWGTGARAFTAIHLDPLSTNEMEQILAGLVPGLPASAVASIVGRADGIPLYAVETVRMLLSEGRLVLEGDAYRPVGSLDDVAVPETLTALIAARLDALEPGDRGILEDAAVLGQSFGLAGLAAVSDMPEQDLEQRLRGLVRREILVHDMDPRSPERGQYLFVQALTREVAYNTLARKERKVRHLAAARFFEQLGSDELASGLAGHYLAAQRLASDPDEAAALAGQARVALRAAAERATALGSTDQALAFTEQAIEITDDPAQRAELHTSAVELARARADVERTQRHADAAVEERRRTGDRQAIAIAAAARARGWVRQGDPARGLVELEPLWKEFADLEETPAGIELMLATSRALRALDRFDTALEWADRSLPLAERIGTLEQISRAMLERGTSLLVGGRPVEGMVLLRGAHAAALANGFREVESNARVLLTFNEQWGDPVAGLALGREGMELAVRQGSREYAWLNVGNPVICALRVGEWDWVATLLDEWLPVEMPAVARYELFVDRAILASLRGQDASADLGAGARLQAELEATDPQIGSYQRWAEAWAAFIDRQYDEARRLGEQAKVTSYFAALVGPLLVRAALWNGDGQGAAGHLADLQASGFRGAALGADITLGRAGIAALEGRSAEAVAGYREALRAYGHLGLAFEQAAAAVDMATLLPSSELTAPEPRAAIEAARATLERLGAGPFLDRLERAEVGSSR
jgi:class 3 adenylate cyclase/tetratricopeptide (TPR) repeat protein